MGVQGRFTIAAAAGADREPILADADATFADLDALEWTISSWRPRSELSRAVAAATTAPGVPVSIGPELAGVLVRAQRLAAATGGAFDVTCGPLVDLWRSVRRAGRLPDPPILADARSRTGWTLLSLPRSTARPRGSGTGLVLRRAGMRLDLGGIGKGVAADRALASLRERGHDAALVAIAGDVAAGAAPPGTAGWRVVLADGRTVLLEHAAASTSGDDEQFAIVDGVRYAHVVDPATGLGHRHRRTVSVVADEAGVTDPLASALYALGPRSAWPLLVRHRAAAIFVERDASPPRVVVVDPWDRLPAIGVAASAPRAR